MSMELTEHADGRDSQESRDTLFLLGGAAMVVFGAGLNSVDAHGPPLPGRRQCRKPGTGGHPGL